MNATDTNANPVFIIWAGDRQLARVKAPTFQAACELIYAGDPWFNAAELTLGTFGKLTAHKIEGDTRNPW